MRRMDINNDEGGGRERSRREKDKRMVGMAKIVMTKELLDLTDIMISKVNSCINNSDLMLIL